MARPLPNSSFREPTPVPHLRTYLIGKRPTTPTSKAMERDRSSALVASSYLVAWVIAMSSLFDLFMRLRPFRLSDVSWRIGAVGTTSLQLPLLLLAWLAFCLTAFFLHQTKVLRFSAVVSFVCALLLVSVIPFFALDVLQLRRLVAPEAVRTLDLTMARAALIVVLTSAGVFWMGLAGWKLSGKEKRSTGVHRKEVVAVRRVVTPPAADPGGSDLSTPILKRG